MAITNWLGILNYEGTGVGVEKNEFTRTKLSGVIKVKYFFVEGGTGKGINLDSTGSLPVWSEFDQAKKNNNIVLGLSPDAVDAMHLLALSQIAFPVSIVFSVIGNNGESAGSVYNLRTEKAFITQTPNKEGANGQKITIVRFRISDCELIQGMLGMKISLPSLNIKI